MTTHELAGQLLAGPDIEVLVPKVKEYDDSEGCLAEPMVTIVEARDNEVACKVALISYGAEAPEEPQDLLHQIES